MSNKYELTEYEEDEIADREAALKVKKEIGAMNGNFQMIGKAKENDNPKPK